MGCLWPKISKISGGQKLQILIGWIVHAPIAHLRIRSLMMLLEVAWAVRVKGEVAFLAMRTCSFHVPASSFSSFWKSPSSSFHPCWKEEPPRKGEQEKGSHKWKRKEAEGKRSLEKALPLPPSLSHFILLMGVSPRVPTLHRHLFWSLFSMENIRLCSLVCLFFIFFP